MEWRDEAIVIGVRRHGETAAIVELMTRAHGRHLGLVRGGRSKQMRAVLQQGNGVEAVWRARLEEQLGSFVVEATHVRTSAILSSGQALQGIDLVGALLRLLPERDPHQGLYEAAELVANSLHEPSLGPRLMVHFELMILAELGFGLDLTICAATGATEDLVHVSPKSGRAVSRVAGEPYRDRLLPLPAFLVDPVTQATSSDVVAGFRLTGFFLDREVFAPRGLLMPDTRRAYVEAVGRVTDSRISAACPSA
ncbi:MAG TPA: DNA repair protein RecO [Beijerinckiaceae bacterium]|nr:DNA repair protein RecO [Beijerinckiaceae bacterium]